MIKIFLEYNFNVSVDALDYLLDQNISEKDLRQSIQRFPKEIPVISREHLEGNISSTDQRQKISETSETQNRETSRQNEPTDQLPIDSAGREQLEERKKEKTKKIKLKIHRSAPKINVKMDIPERSSDKPNVETFRQLFLNRYEQLSSILKNNIKETTPLLKQNLTKEQIPKDINGILIGMVQDTRVLTTNKFVIHLENPKSEILTRCVMVQDSESFPGYRDILRDSVVGIKGVLPKKFQGGYITAFWGKDIIRPSFQPKEFRATTDSHKILFVSDIHFGSQNFVRSVFAKLIKFLTLNDLDSEFQKLASEISTLMIVGDLVEGVGLFPDQKSDILYHSLQTQYDGLSVLLRDIPEDIKIIVIPGEHDATQIPNPQPAIDKKFAKALLNLPNLRSFGNPIRLSIENMSILAFHGQKNEVLFEKHIHLDPLNPIIGIQHLLEYRHLYPEYGSFNPIAPFKHDYLVIDEVPDIVVSGHFHQAHFKEYRGVKILTCGSFQKEEHKQSKNTINTYLGVFPILDTHTGEVEMIDLKKL